MYMIYLHMHLVTVHPYSKHSVISTTSFFTVVFLHLNVVNEHHVLAHIHIAVRPCQFVITHIIMSYSPSFHARQITPPVYFITFVFSTSFTTSAYEQTVSPVRLLPLISRSALRRLLNVVVLTYISTLLTSSYLSCYR